MTEDVGRLSHLILRGLAEVRHPIWRPTRRFKLLAAVIY